MSTHNPEHALLFAGRVLALHNGEVAAAGPATCVLNAGLIRTLYGVDVELRRNSEGSVSCTPLLNRAAAPPGS
jgi:iron complex transport system ATP-binding protein